MTNFRNDTEETIIEMLGREDYYMLLKKKKSPDDIREIRWQTMRTKWAILHQNGLL